MKKMMQTIMMHMCMFRMLISQAVQFGPGAMAFCLAPVID